MSKFHAHARYNRALQITHGMNLEFGIFFKTLSCNV